MPRVLDAKIYGIAAEALGEARERSVIRNR
jgi:hypothetical protein